MVLSALLPMRPGRVDLFHLVGANQTKNEGHALRDNQAVGGGREKDYVVCCYAFGVCVDVVAEAVGVVHQEVQYAADEKRHGQQEDCTDHLAPVG